jgi:hypothetical protein
MATSFMLGERVRLRASISLPEGTLGSVHKVVLNVPNMYYVQFDGYNHPTLMHAAGLERIEEARSSDRERAVGAD